MKYSCPKHEDVILFDLKLKGAKSINNADEQSMFVSLNEEPKYCEFCDKYYFLEECNSNNDDNT